jgi:hypothetical protein
MMAPASDHLELSARLGSRHRRRRSRCHAGRAAVAGPLANSGRTRPWPSVFDRRGPALAAKRREGVLLAERPERFFGRARNVPGARECPGARAGRGEALIAAVIPLALALATPAFGIDLPQPPFPTVDADGIAQSRPFQDGDALDLSCSPAKPATPPAKRGFRVTAAEVPSDSVGSGSSATALSRDSLRLLASLRGQARGQMG